MLFNIEAPLPPELDKELTAVYFKKPYAKLNRSLAALQPGDAQRLVGQYQLDKKFYRGNFQMTLTCKTESCQPIWGSYCSLTKAENG